MSLVPDKVAEFMEDLAQVERTTVNMSAGREKREKKPRKKKIVEIIYEGMRCVWWR